MSIFKQTSSSLRLVAISRIKSPVCPTLPIAGVTRDGCMLFLKTLALSGALTASDKI